MILISKYVCAKAKIKCSDGSIESVLDPDEGHKVIFERKIACRASDNEVTNIGAFGQCSSDSNDAVVAARIAENNPKATFKCAPVISSKWSGTKSDVLIKGEEALLEGSTLSCDYGTIIITDPNQTKVEEGE